MKAAKIFMALALCFAVALPQVFAQDMWEKAESEDYKVKVGPMLGRGFLNVVTSPVDMLVQTIDQTQDGPPLIGTLTGMAGGLGCTALRAGSGLIDVALFWVPSFNGFPVSRSFHNCLVCPEDEIEVIEEVGYIQQPVATSVPTSLVTVTETEDVVVATPKRKIHDPYKYVKK